MIGGGRELLGSTARSFRNLDLGCEIFLRNELEKGLRAVYVWPEKKILVSSCFLFNLAWHSCLKFIVSKACLQNLPSKLFKYLNKFLDLGASFVLDGPYFVCCAHRHLRLVWAENSHQLPNYWRLPTNHLRRQLNENKIDERFRSWQKLPFVIWCQLLLNPWWNMYWLRITKKMPYKYQMIEF